MLGTILFRSPNGVNLNLIIVANRRIRRKSIARESNLKRFVAIRLLFEIPRKCGDFLSVDLRQSFLGKGDRKVFLFYLHFDRAGADIVSADRLSVLITGDRIDVGG